jgi:hypothetical protein
LFVFRKKGHNRKYTHDTNDPHVCRLLNLINEICLATFIVVIASALKGDVYVGEQEPLLGARGPGGSAADQRERQHHDQDAGDQAQGSRPPHQFVSSIRIVETNVFIFVFF